ncbi:Rho GTPase-activating protein 7 [Zea mays]|uniref:Rho GTPase-activating protein 7 n=1 Tax=Zea mays TaxID=4577 RepID=A0A3L6DWU3_MAIZE|nr:Rho GTPase-activating protein 7 [Zea mays]
MHWRAVAAEVGALQPLPSRSSSNLVGPPPDALARNHQGADKPSSAVAESSKRRKEPEQQQPAAPWAKLLSQCSQSSPPMDLEKSVPRVDPFGGVDVTLREGKLEVFKSGPLFISSKGIGWKSWKKRWFILTQTSLVFFKSDPSTLPQRSGEVNLTLGGIDLKLPQRSGEVNLTFWEAENSKDLFEWKTSLEEALAQAPNAALVMGHNGIFRNDTIDVCEKWFEDGQARGSSDEDSSEDESNDDSDHELAKKAAAKPLGAVAKNGLKKETCCPTKENICGCCTKEKKRDSSESDSDDDSDEEVPPKSKAPAATIKKEDSSESESESDSEVEGYLCSTLCHTCE